MSLWVDKHRPTSLAKLDYHTEQAAQLSKLVKSGDFPHLLVYGPSGAGKKTRVMCLLRDLYGAGVDRLRIEHQNFETPSKRKLEVVTVASNYHIEVNPSDAGNNDRVVIQELLKTVAQTHQLNSDSQRDFKVVVVTEADRLTRDAQHGLRRTMERYSATCRLVLVAQSSSQVIAPVRSRCLALRVPAPSHQQIVSVLQHVCKKEGLAIPTELAERIAQKSGRNLRRAILMCETCRVQQVPLTADQLVVEPDWELFLQETAAQIVQDQSPRRLGEIRSRLYELMVHCIPADLIFKVLLRELTKNCDSHLKSDITQDAAAYEHRLRLGSKPIYHMEAFVAKFMVRYKQFLDQALMDMD